VLVTACLVDPVDVDRKGSEVALLSDRNLGAAVMPATGRAWVEAIRWERVARLTKITRQITLRCEVAWRFFRGHSCAEVLRAGQNSSRNGCLAILSPRILTHGPGNVRVGHIIKLAAGALPSALKLGQVINER
jgi:hypothetical protein